MCLAIPAKIIGLDGETAQIDYGGVIKKVNTRFVEKISVGDYILVHAGFAIEKIDVKTAEESIRLLNEMVGDD